MSQLCCIVEKKEAKERNGWIGWIRPMLVERLT